METVSVHAAKTNLSRLIKAAEAGTDVVIARRKTPVVRLVPVASPPQVRRFGAMAGRSRVTKAFFEPLPDGEQAAWE